MRIPLDWLREYVDPGVEPQALAHRLTMSGTNIESIEATKPRFSGVFVGKVLESARHPNADKLSLCRVAVGSEEFRIVCGAPNVRAGLTVAVAKVGAMLPGDFKIRRSKIRGEVSEGMICSARELGMGDEHQGILELDARLESGRDFAALAGGGQVVFEAEITPNRPDCLSIWGVAREVAALYEVPLRAPATWQGQPTRDSRVSVQIESAADCARYLGRTIRGVRVAESPDWLQQRLRALGHEPINNVVDVTNFVLFETGQPLHAFDLARLAGARIVVRRARPGEMLRTLDGVRRELDAGVLVIADAAQPVAIAGVMGGADSAVQDGTKDLLLESAWFRPDLVRSGRRRLGLDTDASYRFERGADIVAARWAADRATELLLQLAGGRVEESDADAYPVPYQAPELRLRVQRVERLVGASFTAASIAALLQRLGLEAKADGDAVWVLVPSFRRDLCDEIDLVEEVARLHGYENIPDDVLPPAPLQPTPHVLDEFLSSVRTAMVGLGFYEGRTSAFMDRSDPDRLQLAPADPRRKAVHVCNPIVKSLDTMRTTLVPNLLRAMRHNLNYGQESVRFAQVDRVFLDEPGPYAGLPHEKERLCLVVCGSARPEGWGGEARPYDVFDLKGDVAALLERLRVDTRWRYGYTEPFLEPSASFTIASNYGDVGAGGVVSEAVARSFDIDVPVFAFDLDLETLLQSAADRRQVAVLPRFPAVKRDLSLVVPEPLRYEEVESVAREAGGRYLESIECFDVFEGRSGAPRSIGLRLRFRSGERTLTDQEVDPAVATIVQQLGARLRVRLREY